MKARRTSARRRVGVPDAASVRARRGGVAVDEEQRRHLIEDCAFFRADHFREAEPGGYRNQDLQAAAAAIDAAIKLPRKGRKR